MNTTMFDAREAMIPGSVYDRSSHLNGGPPFFNRTHDQISYISPERAQGNVANLPVPIGMFMNMAHIPPRFYNQHQQALQGNQNLSEQIKPSVFFYFSFYKPKFLD